MTRATKQAKGSRRATVPSQHIPSTDRYVPGRPGLAFMLGSYFLGNVIRLENPNGSISGQTCVAHLVDLVELLCVKSIDYEGGQGLATYMQPYREACPGIPADFIKGFDAGAISRGENRSYTFRGDMVVGYDLARKKLAFEPKPIADLWPGLPSRFAGGFTAVAIDPGRPYAYFVKDDTIICYDTASQQLVFGPQAITDRWPNLPTEFMDGIEAMGVSSADLMLLVKGRHCVFYDTVTKKPTFAPFRFESR